MDEDIFIIPESGYGRFDSYFNRCYNEATNELREKNSHWIDENGDIKDEYQHDYIGEACDMAEIETIEYIKSLGYKVVNSDGSDYK